MPRYGNKYGNMRTMVDDIKFSSKKEARRYGELKLLLAAGEIGSLKLQPRFPLEIAGQLICTYVADFAYTSHKTGKRIVEDAKGFRTDVYRIKKKLVKAIYDIEIQEV